MRVLVTGASGFIGAAVVDALRARGVAVRAASRARSADADAIVVSALGAGADWRRALEGVDVVVHLAGPADARYSEAELHRAIVEGAAGLAAQAEAAGAKRFVFVSSVKAAAARARAPLCEADAPAPGDAYGRAKLAAEQAVLVHAALQPVALRPPLVFAPEAGGNFARLLKLADSGVPLPLAALDNRRSLISRASLIDAVAAVLNQPDGPGGVFYVRDSGDVSTAELVASLRRGMGRPRRLFSAPGLEALLPAPMRESLAVDDSRFRIAYGYGARGDCDVVAELEACAREWKARR